MEEYVDYLKGKFKNASWKICTYLCLFKEVLNTYLSFLDAAKLKASLHNKVGIVTAGSRQLVKLPDLQSSMV
jgi:hypothetical protein